MCYLFHQAEAFSAVMCKIAETESVAEHCVMFVHNDKSLRPTDTPNSIEFQCADIIGKNLGQTNGYEQHTIQLFITYCSYPCFQCKITITNIFILH